jgi:energy-converting hydrogenase A subunit C
MIEKIIGIIIIIMAIRVLITKNRVERVLYINVIDFGLSALITIYINTPFGFIVASAFFITSTISSNAIAYTFKRLKNELVYN